MRANRRFLSPATRRAVLARRAGMLLRPRLQPSKDAGIYEVVAERQHGACEPFVGLVITPAHRRGSRESGP